MAQDPCKWDSFCDFFVPFAGSCAYTRPTSHIFTFPLLDLNEAHRMKFKKLWSRLENLLWSTFDFLHTFDEILSSGVSSRFDVFPSENFELRRSAGELWLCPKVRELRHIASYHSLPGFLKKINISKTVLILCCYFDAELSHHNVQWSLASLDDRSWATWASLDLGDVGFVLQWNEGAKKSVNRRSKQGGSCVDHLIILIQETWQYMYVSNCIYIMGLLNVM